MNILFTCAGRRNYLLKYFNEALGTAGNVFAADMDATAPAMHEASKSFIVPAVASPDYVQELVDICQREAVDLIIPLNDLELPLLASARQTFSAIGVKVLVSNPDIIDLCFDKIKTNEFLSDNGFSHARTFTDLADARAALARSELSFPLIVKPRWGSASIQIHKVHTVNELEWAYSLATAQIEHTILGSFSEPGVGSILIQETLAGQEHGVDVLNDLEGHFQCVFVKRKLSMRAGETEKSQLVQLHAVERLAEKLSRCLGHIGNLDCDVFVDGDSVSVLELNPRFGGGYPFSHTLGANYPAAIINWARGESYDAEKFIRNYSSVVSKYDNLMVMTAP